MQPCGPTLSGVPAAAKKKAPATIRLFMYSKTRNCVPARSRVRARVGVQSRGSGWGSDAASSEVGGGSRARARGVRAAHDTHTRTLRGMW